MPQRKAEAEGTKITGGGGEQLAQDISIKNRDEPRNDTRRLDAWSLWYTNGKTYHKIGKKDTSAVFLLSISIGFNDEAMYLLLNTDNMISERS